MLVVILRCRRGLCFLFSDVVQVFVEELEVDLAEFFYAYSEEVDEGCLFPPEMHYYARKTVISSLKPRLFYGTQGFSA